MSSDSRLSPPRRRRWLIATAAVGLGVLVAAIALGQRSSLTTNVTIALSYVGDDGRTYSCTYDYRTPKRLPMPADIAQDMNGRDWSETGRLVYEWAKNHHAETWTTQDDLPADDPQSTRAEASWALAMERFVRFPPWTVDAGDGPEYELWWEARQGSDCEDGLR
ncbi:MULTISPECIES: hypothetical protein [unclassified Microbacterium]|uniref:hypothetical protein n=1 Tax=unclassified Microbacterium TaxID=2609290 RepID=UPI0030167B27